MTDRWTYRSIDRSIDRYIHIYIYVCGSIARSVYRWTRSIDYIYMVVATLVGCFLVALAPPPLAQASEGKEPKEHRTERRRSHRQASPYPTLMGNVSSMLMTMIIRLPSFPCPSPSPSPFAASSSACTYAGTNMLSLFSFFPFFVFFFLFFSLFFFSRGRFENNLREYQTWYLLFLSNCLLKSKMLYFLFISSLKQ